LIGGRCKHGNVFSRAVLIGRVTCSIRISLSDFSRWFSDFLARFFSKKPSYLLERASTFHMFATQTCCIGTTLFARFASQTVIGLTLLARFASQNMLSGHDCFTIVGLPSVRKFQVAMAVGIHLFPYRTEQLSPPAPMVLQG
jgi:hypothetical protein